MGKKVCQMLAIGMMLISQIVVLAYARDDVDGKPKVFLASEGKRITIIPIKPKKSGKFLIYFEQTGGDWDGKAILHNRTEGNHGEEYWVQISRKNKWTTFSSKSTWYSGWTTIAVEPYNSGKAEEYYYDQSASEAVNNVALDKILALYKESEKK